MAIDSSLPLDKKRSITGLSTDIKPTDVGVPTFFYETDTGNKFEFRGQPIGWVQV